MSVGIHTVRSDGLYASVRCGNPTYNFCFPQAARLCSPTLTSHLPAAHGNYTVFRANSHRGLQDNGLRIGLSSSPYSVWKYGGRNAQTPASDGKH